ncbi:hypothetical protein [Fusibacter ferrireducens]|uniref:HEPN AbiU2-like domain-containing protein n=1 Tax=Fusibacter ferrireducens TaxID=2785058 RepID=A0ABS0A2D5_9FIRM|nr:hypothetical protein [Fusibacter ferrireducens]MBF4696049.1 hypothetical protein [Fusibacter ferrireducens]
MKIKVDINQLIENYDHEFDNEADWLNFHINLMYNELHEIQNTIYIFETVKKEWDRRIETGERVNYSAIRTVLYTSLPYKIIIGLSKIFVGRKEFSLLKTINKISQMDEYRNRIEVKKIIDNIQKYLETNEMIRDITTYRDQFFAHLDKACVISDCRIDATIAMSPIDTSEIEKGIKLIGELYEVCFNKCLSYSDKKILKKDIIFTFFWM